MIGRLVTNSPANDGRLDAIRQSITNIDNLMNQLTAGQLDNDLDPGRDAWIQTVVDNIKQYESQLEAPPQAAPSTGSSALPPKTKAAVADLFPERTPEGVSLAFGYEAPTPDTASNRAATACPFQLPDSASREQYRHWRIAAAETDVDSQSQPKILEAGVRTFLVASLGPQMRTAVATFFVAELKRRFGTLSISWISAFSTFHTSQREKIAESSKRINLVSGNSQKVPKPS